MSTENIETDTFFNILVAATMFLLVCYGSFGLPWIPWLMLVGFFGYKTVELICNLILRLQSARQEKKDVPKETQHYLIEWWEQECYHANNWIYTNFVKMFI